MPKTETPTRTEGDEKRQQLVREVLADEQVRTRAAWIAQHYGTERATAFVIELADDYGQAKEPVKQHQAKMHNAKSRASSSRLRAKPLTRLRRLEATLARASTPSGRGPCGRPSAALLCGYTGPCSARTATRSSRAPACGS